MVTFPLCLLNEILFVESNTISSIEYDPCGILIFFLFSNIYIDQLVH